MAAKAVAIVDVGSASVQLTVAEVQHDRIEIICKEKKIARLADGLNADGRLDRKSTVDLVATLRLFVARAAEFGVIPWLTATATLRAVRDRKRLLNELEHHLGIPIHIISGSDEARFVWSGVLFAHPQFGRQRTLTVDVGGGSTEFVGALHTKPSIVASVSIGSLVVHRRWLGFEQTTAGGIASARRAIRRFFCNALSLSSSMSPEVLIATGGTIQRLVKMIERRDLSAAEMNGYQLSHKALSRCVETLHRARTRQGRRELEAIDVERADFMLGGALIYDEILSALEHQEWVVSASALRTGLLISRAQDVA